MTEPALYREWNPETDGGVEPVAIGWVVPVERCEHGNIDPHYVVGPIMLPDTDKMCPGAGIGYGDEPCRGCGGQGWYEAVEPDPNDQTGMTPMQVQVQCECSGIGGDDDTH